MSLSQRLFVPQKSWVSSVREADEVPEQPAKLEDRDAPTEMLREGEALIEINEHKSHRHTAIYRVPGKQTNTCKQMKLETGRKQQC